MTILQICALSLAFHEIYYYALQGKESVNISFMPSLGLSLSPTQKTLLHASLLIACLWTFIGREPFEGLLLYILFPVYLAAHSWRISNHLMVIFFLLLIDIGKYFYSPVLHNQDFSKLAIFLILLLIYFFGAFHKLNTEFFDVTSSCANRYFDFFTCTVFRSKKYVPHLLCRSIASIIVLLEASVFYLLLFPPPTRGYVAFWLALLLHFLFGITGNLHFSFLMLLLISSFCSTTSEVSINANVGVSALVFIALSYLMIDRTQFRNRFAGLMCISIFGALFGYSAYSISTSPRELLAFFPQLSSIGNDVLFLYSVIAIMATNCLSPYFWKTEFSLAMFSNLRPDRQNHFILNTKFHKNLLSDRYYEIVSIEGLGLLRGYRSQTVDAVILFLAKHTDFLYSARFLNEFSKLVEALGTVTVDIQVRRYGTTEIESLNVRAPLSAGGLATKFNLFPPYLAKKGNAPYMG